MNQSSANIDTKRLKPLLYCLALSAIFLVYMDVSFAQAPSAAKPDAKTNGISSLKKHDTKAPIDVDAEATILEDAQNQAVLTKAIITQANLKLSANKVRIFYTKGNQDDLTILRADAEGSVLLTSPSERVSASYGIYDVESRQITMVGNVVLHRGDNVLRGQRLAVDLETGITRLDGGTNAQGNGKNRVTGRFSVPERKP